MMFQTEMSSIMFPKIGAIFRAEDGNYDVGPLPGLGGPFNTATEYLRAWARNARFASLSHLPYDKEGCGEYYEEIVAQIEEFPVSHLFRFDYSPFQHVSGAGDLFRLLRLVF